MITTWKAKDEAEWKAFRNNYIGGSDAGCVVGLNPYKGAFSLWMEKTGQAEPFEGNLTTRCGQYLEDLVADLFEEETGKKVHRVNSTFLNDEYPFAIANIDRAVVGEDAGLECKTTNSMMAIKKFKNGEYPEQWYCQCMHYMAITGKSKWYLAVLVSCRDFRLFTIERDEDEINALMEAEKAFWNGCVVPKKAPGVTGAEADVTAYGEYANRMTTDEDDIDLAGMETHFDKLMMLNAEIKQLTMDKEAEETAIKEAIGEHSYGHCNNYKCSFKQQEKKTFDRKALEKDHPEINLEPYHKKSSYRVFRYAVEDKTIM